MLFRQAPFHLVGADRRAGISERFDYFRSENLLEQLVLTIERPKSVANDFRSRGVMPVANAFLDLVSERAESDADRLVKTCCHAALYDIV